MFVSPRLHLLGVWASVCFHVRDGPSMRSLQDNEQFFMPSVHTRFVVSSAFNDGADASCLLTSTFLFGVLVKLAVTLSLH